MEVSVGRLKRTRGAQFVKRTVLRRGRPMLPRLSVVVPFHSAVGQLETCVESLLAQTHPNLEVVLVDDGSVDGSAEVAERLARAHRSVRLVLSMHSTRPVRQRSSSGPGTLCSPIASRDGSEVMPCSRSRVRWSTSPVTGICRFSWKPRTASTVAAS